MGLNQLRTFMLLAALTALFIGVGYLIGGQTGMLLALGFAVVTNLISYWNADKIVLSMYRAKIVDESHPDPRVRAYVQDVKAMAQKAGMPLPKITLMENGQPNAFATGRDPEHAAVAATSSLLEMLDRDEVRAVMGHELAHVKNRDTLTMTVTATVAGAISALANFGLFFGGGDRDRPGGVFAVILVALLAPMAAALVQMAISRGREYAADRTGAEISGDPRALASALEKIEAYAKRGAYNVQAERNPATAHMFIINPLAGKGADNLFSTHPATANRVRALNEMSQGLPARPRMHYETAVPATPSHQPGPWG
ncbi:zinc metalloprotease HtpX [Brevundimonas sp. 2R-24]|uniref:Protease HtpX homolog n=1 Tax=Peiella sedimenti TaxID=3061083 RepID=A0ABT8SQ34_9CAUL|nr:zinc metalloprotease HtpX [Caulobacteraceae bacterium XZ-24]